MVPAGPGAVRSDARLVALAREGDDGAFGELYRRYHHLICAFVARRVGDPTRAEDITQDTFLSALRRLRATSAEIHWKPWLYEIARNATIDFHRRRGRAKEVSVDREELLRPSDRRRLEVARAPDSELELKQRFDHLREAFDELPAGHHRILVMRELEGLSYSEIGERLDATRPAVESTLFRARRRLAREYEEVAGGRRCSSARATIALIAEGLDPGAERRRLARHARRCSACRRQARELGVEPLFGRRLRERAAALLPFGWLLRRGPAPQPGETVLLGCGGQVGAGLAERVAAILAAAALACAGTISLGGVPQAGHPAPDDAGGKATPPQSLGPSTTGAPARPRTRSSAPQRPAHRRAAPPRRSGPARRDEPAPRAPAPAASPTRPQAAHTPAPAPVNTEAIESATSTASLPVAAPAPPAVPEADAITAPAKVEPELPAQPSPPSLPAELPVAKNVAQALHG